MTSELETVMELENAQITDAAGESAIVASLPLRLRAVAALAVEISHLGLDEAIRSNSSLFEAPESATSSLAVNIKI